MKTGESGTPSGFWVYSGGHHVALMFGARRVALRSGFMCSVDDDYQEAHASMTAAANGLNLMSDTGPTEPLAR